VATKPLNVLPFGAAGVFISLLGMILIIISHWNSSDAWSSLSVVLSCVLALLGLLGVGGVSSGVVSLLSAPRAKHKTGFDLGLSIISLLPAILLAVVAVVLVEALIHAFQIPVAQIPAPTAVIQKFLESRQVLWRDTQTTLLEAGVGYVIGASLGFIVAILVSRYQFLNKGLMPYATIFSSIPIVALAPVIVKAAGLEWGSKAAVVAITIFFPVLVNTARGLLEVNPLTIDLMRSYAANPRRVFMDLRIPNALPYIFNALKISTTLALIGAIVAEFFGSTGSGLGFRILVETGQASFDSVWAAINIASFLGIVFYNLAALLERRVTGWHVSFRE
jgi:NitT/TauT family transport system permease protein